VLSGFETGHAVFFEGGDEMAESVGEGFRAGGCGFGEKVRLKVAAIGVIVVRSGEDRMVCEEVQAGEGLWAGYGGEVSVLSLRRSGVNVIIPTF
jgi:hypothetical protein